MKILLIVVGVLIVLAGGMYAFREPLFAAVTERMTADMFVPKDDDAYDVGVAIGRSSRTSVRASAVRRSLT